MHSNVSSIYRYFFLSIAPRYFATSILAKGSSLPPNFSSGNAIKLRQPLLFALSRERSLVYSRSTQLVLSLLAGYF